MDKEVAAGRKSKMKCIECGKKWMAARREKVEEGECGECREAKRRKEAAHPTKGNVQQKEEAKEERDVRRMIKMLKKVWMQVGLEKVDSHEGVPVKALLDSCQDANSELELSLYSLSALDKENSLESLLHWSTYLYIIYLVCALSIPHSQPNHV